MNVLHRIREILRTIVALTKFTLTRGMGIYTFLAWIVLVPVSLYAFTALALLLPLGLGVLTSPGGVYGALSVQIAALLAVFCVIVWMNYMTLRFFSPSHLSEEDGLPLHP